VDQGTVKKLRGVNPPYKLKKSRGRVKFYALAISVFAHVFVLSVFAAVKLSQPAPASLKTAAVVGVCRAAALAERPVVAPKPKVVSENRPQAATKERASSNLKSRIANFKQIPNPNNQLTISSDVHGEPVETPALSEPITAQAEFFGSAADGRRICYVVDCSGSMQGLWQRVRAELVESIARLEQDQYFCVIVFGGGSILQSGGGRMIRATAAAKKEAFAFIDSLRPAGETNASEALQQAVRVRENAGQPASVIYFLTDGFELSEKDRSRFAHEVATMIRSFSPKTRINTIGLWPNEPDIRTLERIARDSGGRFTLIGETDKSQ
jgi:hypothetical protein